MMSAAQTTQRPFTVKDKDILCPEGHRRQEIACTALKQEFQGKGERFLTNCVLQKLSIKGGKII